MKYSIFTFFTIVVLSINIFSQNVKNYTLDSIVVTANRVPSSLSEIGRSIRTISNSEVKSLPASNLQDLLEYTSGLDVKQRGPEGIQADVSIRGGSFEQTLIMIDGIRLTDPQTGHHNMNLPISYSQIDRVEILKGQGSRIYGANAFSGVINIIPKRSPSTSLELGLKGGEKGYFDLAINGSAEVGNTVHYLSISRTKSDGYRRNTEFDNYNVSMNNTIRLSNGIIKTLFGYTEKDFGANSYYTIRFPDQAEITKTLLTAISAEFETDGFKLFPKIHWRKNEDEFVLNKFDPEFYKNNHETNVYGGEFQVSTDILGGYTSFGLEYTQDNIKSNNLGEHKRERKGFFIEQKVNLSKSLSFSMGGFAYYYSKIAWNFWPGLDIAYNISDNLKLFTNYGRAFRIPNYTELFYSDPITEGNSELKPEKSINYEIGFNFSSDVAIFSGSYFIKDGKNLIDYVFQEENDIWKAQNFSEIYTDGFEASINFNLDNISSRILKRFIIDYTFLNSDKTELDLKSRYVLEHLNHDLTIKLFHDLIFGISQSWAINYEERVSLGDHFTIDTKLSKNFSNFSLFLKANNLLNKTYEEIPGVPLPGRWIIGGVSFEIL